MLLGHLRRWGSREGGEGWGGRDKSDWSVPEAGLVGRLIDRSVGRSVGRSVCLSIGRGRLRGSAELKEKIRTFTASSCCVLFITQEEAHSANVEYSMNQCMVAPTARVPKKKKRAASYLRRWFNVCPFRRGGVGEGEIFTQRTKAAFYVSSPACAN